MQIPDVTRSKKIAEPVVTRSIRPTNSKPQHFRGVAENTPPLPSGTLLDKLVKLGGDTDPELSPLINALRAAA